MGPRTWDPRPCWVSWILGLSSLLLSTSSTGAQSSRVKVPGADLPLQGVRGGAVLFHMSHVQATELLEMQWGVGADTNFTVMLRVQHGPSLTWFSLQDKYGQRVRVPNTTSLRIENLTPEDSGRYWARPQLKDGTGISQGFQLTVHEPVPPPQIRIKSVSITANWCNVTLECGTTGHSKNLSVTWESEGLPSDLGGWPQPGPAPNSWPLAVSLSLSQPNASLTCVLSNPGDQKSATKALGEVCTPTLTPEPVPQTQIQIHSSSHTSGWCNVSMECEVPGDKEHLAVAWELPRELEQSEPLGLVSNSWNISLPLPLPLPQTNTSLNCVVSNPVDRKIATFHLPSICSPEGLCYLWVKT
ncbi:PREDICTED: uncharacterized protein LOC105854436 [Condylura cristata]|uniref:uncharacterized protein LOC105854436 n=1 Tax=Condylura cristata TaxID=143302 RepID=UPI000643A3CE|nr:PREDICTED: uncharacterized protein LOC105854436 [Condylura cristata]